jgi:hypothetical protein
MFRGDSGWINVVAAHPEHPDFGNAALPNGAATSSRCGAPFHD